MSTNTMSLGLLKTNAKRLRTIYGWLAFAGFIGCGFLGAYLGLGGKPGGPVIAVAIVAIGLLAMGGGLLLLRRKQDARILQLLIHEPQAIARVFPKQSESALHGATVARYHWIVIECRDGAQLDLYSSADDFDGVLAEVRGYAPNAVYDPTLVKERMNIHVR